MTPTISITPTETPTNTMTPSVTPTISLTPTITPTITRTPTQPATCYKRTFYASGLPYTSSCPLTGAPFDAWVRKPPGDLSVCDTIYVDFVNPPNGEEFCRTDGTDPNAAAYLGFLADPDYTLSISDGYQSCGWISGVGGPDGCFRPTYIAVSEVVACI